MTALPLAFMGPADARTVRVCAYCPDKAAADAQALAAGLRITHGICPACEPALLAQVAALPDPATHGAFVALRVVAEVCGLSEGTLAKQWPRDMRIGRDWRRSGEAIEVAEHALSYVVAALATGGEPEAARRLMNWVIPSGTPAHLTAGCEAPASSTGNRAALRTSLAPARESLGTPPRGNWQHCWEEKNS